MNSLSKIRTKRAVAKPAAVEECADASVWTQQSLSTLIQSQLGHRHMVIVANREPLIKRSDQQKDNATKAVSGLVSALFPFIVSTGGTWISHASGQQTSTDFEDFGINNTMKIFPTRDSGHFVMSPLPNRSLPQKAGLPTNK